MGSSESVEADNKGQHTPKETTIIKTGGGTFAIKGTEVSYQNIARPSISQTQVNLYTRIN